jgi:Flp pilus assembly protein TadG
MNTKHFERRGATTVEMALTLPILFLLLFGGYELSRANMIMHTCEAAAYEGARVGIVPGATAAQAQTAAEGVLRTTGIKNATIEVNPSNLANASETIAVTIEVAFADNTLLAPLFVGDLRLVRTCELLRESF